jgi:hypothetical protein
MPGFGTSVSAYNQKPDQLLEKFKLKSPTIQPMASVNTSVSQLSKTPTNQPQTANPQKSALNGSSTINASGLVNTIQSPVFQPRDTGEIGRKTGSEYGPLRALDQRTQILNDDMDMKVAAHNAMAQKRNATIEQGYSSGADSYDVTGNSGLDNEQMGYAKQIASIGKQRGLDDQAVQIAIMTALAESEMRNISHGDRDSVGLFQQRTSQGWGSIQQIMDPNYSINKFYDSLAKTNYKAMNPWQAAQSVQKSFDPTGSNYQARYSTAMRAFNALTPRAQAVANNATNGAYGWTQQNNNKYLDYDGQFGAQCVDLYNFYTSKFVGGDPMMGRVGYAQDIYNNYDPRVYQRLGGNVSGRMGDVAVFRVGPGTLSSHVAIVVGDNGNGTLRVLQSNATSAGSAGPSIISNISKATLMGYLRPNSLGG